MATIRDELKKWYKEATGQESTGANIAEVLAELKEAGVLPMEPSESDDDEEDQTQPK